MVTENVKLTEKYLKFLEENSKSLSVVSCWEISLLLKKKRIEIKYPFREWIINSIKAYGIELINLDLETIFVYNQLDNFHGDPADKFIAATSISRKIPLITFDQKLIQYSALNIIKL